ncbi:MAG TPA: NADH-quinone oxidoreductase subunit N [Luteolibacter sp.]|nr:NADH-quinone oxidoreductase subunit N [Luteolibacter sp.]
MTPLQLLQQLLPETILVVGALLILGLSLMCRRSCSHGCSSGRSWLAAGTMLLAALAVCYQDNSLGGVSGLLFSDPLARVFKCIVLGLGVLAAWLLPARGEMRNTGEFYALLLFAVCGLVLAVGTRNLLMLFVALELASLSLYLLVAFPRTIRTAEVSLKYFLFGGVSAAFMLFGLSLIHGALHSVDLELIRMKLTTGPLPLLAMAGLVMVLVGLGFKLAAAPFHYWAPDVYQGAPATVVALISAASKVVGMVVLVRILVLGFGSAAGSAAWGGLTAGWSLWLALLAAVSIIFGNVLALAQKSVRRLLAYSAVANTGYLLVGVCANGQASAGASLFYVVVYGLATLGALAVCASVERSRGDDLRTSFTGLVHRSPLQAVALLICLASLAGIPPLAGFVGKFAVFSKALADNDKLVWLVILGAVMSAVSLYYYLGVLKEAFVRDGEATAPAEALPLAHRMAITVPALALLLLGLCPSLLLEPIALAVKTLIGN